MAELEKLDPETVKTAKSLMAFGALGRARGMATAANSGGAGTAGAKPQAATEAERVTSVTVDPKQGFAASAGDDKVDSTSIPDPAGYGDGAVKRADVAKSVNGGVAARGPVDAAVAAATSPGVAQPGSVTAVSSHVNPLLVAGVPLAAAVVLMGVYWLILRVGAV
jgi:hypothetical protein